MPRTDFVDSIIPPDRIGLVELAERLGVHQSTVFRWAQHGVRGVRLRVTKCGGRSTVTAVDLRRFFERLNLQKDPARGGDEGSRA
jgi:hypothetical protein